MTASQANLAAPHAPDAPADPTPPADAAPAPPSPPGLMSRIKRSVGWTTGGYAFNQACKLGANVLLAWLLVPEYWGLMFYVTAILTGVQMLSDVGINAGIIQQRGADRPAYLNTAWTVSVIRGFLLWAIASALAFPMAWAFDPALLYLLPVAALTSVITGFKSTRIATLNRELNLKWVTLVDVARMLINSAVMIAFALIYPSVWALVAGSLTSALVSTILSHRLNRATPNRFQIDPDALRQMLGFGIWVFFSSICTFAAMHADKFLLGKLLGTETLGLFAIAFGLSTFSHQFIKLISSRVGFPALSELFRKDEDRFRQKLRKFRTTVATISAGIAAAMATFGYWLIDLAYPPEFQAAGWVVMVLSINSIFGALNSTYGNAFLAMGQTRRIMILVAAQFYVAITLALYAYGHADLLGLDRQTAFIGTMMLVQLLIYPVYAVIAFRARILDPRLDLPVLAFGLAVGALLILSRDLPNFPIPGLPGGAG